VENKRVPEIRIPGFDREWEEMKLSDLYNVYSGQTPLRSDSSNFDNPNTAWIKTTDLNNSAITRNEENISEKAAEKLKILKCGTVLIAMYGGFNQIGRTGLLTYPATINQALSALEPNDNIVPYFLITELNFRVNEWQRLAASSRKDPNITKKDVESFIFNFPSYDEQTKIGNFFKHLDDVITIHEQELTTLKQTKQGFLEKIYSQEIRFRNEFGEDFPNWETSALSKVLSIPEKEIEKNVSKNKLLTVKLHRNGVQINQNTATLKIGSTNYYKRKSGQFIYGKQNFFNGAFDIIPDRYDGYLSSGDIPTLNIDENKIFPLYLLYYMGRESFYRRAEKFSSGTGSKRIHETTLLKINIKLPTMKEQQKIGNFFKQLDDTIALHEQELDTLKQTKKAFLQKMFV